MSSFGSNVFSRNDHSCETRQFHASTDRLPNTLLCLEGCRPADHQSAVLRCTADSHISTGNVGRMGDKPSSEDDDLLARLNALKHSHVSFDSSSKSMARPVEEGVDNTPEDLLARFQRIHGREVTAMQYHQKDSSAARDTDRSASPTVDELLAELGSEEDYIVHRSEVEEAQALMAEASGPLLILFRCWCASMSLDVFHQ